MSNLSLSQSISLIWIGLIIGVAFIAAPAKFQAPSLTLPVALEVGRAQFSWGAIAELILSALLLLSILIWRGVNWIFAITAIAVFAVQHIFIMPDLDARTLKIIAGETVPSSKLHIVYIILECLKMLFLGLSVFKRN